MLNIEPEQLHKFATVWFVFVAPRPTHQAPRSNVPADLRWAGGHLAGLDGGRAEQSAAGRLLELHTIGANTGHFSGLFT